MNNLRMIREEKGLSRMELAITIGVTERYVYALENGTRTPSLHMACKIAERLGRTIDEIFLPKE